MPSTPSVRVRMYRQGLGDCFLVTFDPGGDEAHILIDCGTLGAKTTGVKLKDVVEDIKTTTGGHLHVLIATHEHQDHVSGIRSQKKVFENDFTVDHVWLAWTENPEDEYAREIQEYKNDLGLMLAGAAGLLGASADTGSRETGKAIESLLGFLTESGDEEIAGVAAAAAAAGDELKDGIAKTIDEAMDFVRTGFGPEKTSYLKPGRVLEPDWIPGFRFYVLGPPRDKSKLANMGDKESEELYHLSGGLRTGVTFHATADSLPDESEMPFDRRYGFKSEDPLVSPHLDSYLAEKQQWRRIDSEWLHSAADLALQLDDMINNTSLALAIERVADGKVLLFPGDAQEGNWLSWHDPGMVFNGDGGREPVGKTAAELLAATVFYKVGHHSSHNATAKGKGLQLMSQGSELVAFIPVDRAVALGRSPKNSWKMPANGLYTALLEKCEGRVARSDTGWADDAANAANPAVEAELAGIATAAKWRSWKRSQDAVDNKAVTITAQYIDYFLD